MTAWDLMDWNGWRERYDYMTFADHQAFNAEVLTHYPAQQHFDANACRNFLAARGNRLDVAELGGWDGALAKLMLEEARAASWDNYDITPGVPQVCHHPDYEYVVLDRWPWRRKVKADALVASHVLEHLKLDEVDKLLSAWDCPHVYVDTPISRDGTSWDDYAGTHILEAGSTELLELFDSHDYVANVLSEGTRLLVELDR